MTMLTDVSIIILAGGMGTRLQSVVADKPKALAAINDRPFITFLLDQLITFGARQVTLAAGYKGVQLAEALGPRHKTLELVYSTEPSPLGTGGGLRYALPTIETENVLVMNGDSFIDADLGTYFDWFHRHGHQSALMLTQVEDVGRYGMVRLENDRVVSFEEKGSYQGEGLINAGVYLLNRALIENISPDTPYSLEHDFFPEMIPKGLFGFCTQGAFIDIGTPETFAQGTDFFSKFNSLH